METWKDIPKFEGYYEISNYGRVRSYHSYSKGMSATPKLLTLSNDRKGYKQVVLVKNGKKKYAKVHRLVGEVFVPNPENKPQVNHKDLNKSNNYASNIEWCTCKENINHYYRTAPA